MARITLVLLAILTAVGADRPAPMFSREYVEALQGVLDLEPADAAALEHRLAKNPEDFAARLKLIAYSARADRAALESSRREQAQLLLWLVEHHPDSEILASPYGTFPRADLTAEPLWRAALAKYPKNAKGQWNAALFYQTRDVPKYLETVSAAVALDPGNQRYGTALGLFYARQIIEETALARLAQERLQTTGNPFVLEGAVKLLQDQYNKSRMLGHNDARAGELAARYFARAKSLDPNLDAAWIYPRLDPKMTGILITPRPAPPVIKKEYRRLNPDAFPDLPRSIAAVLGARNCLIPQPAESGPPRNAIHGEFYKKGEISWAVLCGTGEASVILAFRSASDAHPAEFAKWPNQNYIEDGSYAREITVVDRKFMMEHYRAYGGPQPPPIDHEGIDDAFLEKASITYYWYQGQWRELSGSD